MVAVGEYIKPYINGVQYCRYIARLSAYMNQLFSCDNPIIFYDKGRN